MNSKQPQSNLPTARSSTATFPDPIPGLIPHGSLCFLVGPPKCGKTSALASLEVRLRDSKTVWGRQTHCPSDFGIITTDHKWHLNQGPWFERAGFPDIEHVALRDDSTIQWRFALSNRNWAQDQLGKCLQKLNLAKGGFVVIDVAGVFIAKRLNDYNECLVGINIISQLMDQFEFTVLLLSHMAKQKANPKDRYLRPHDRILGSGAQVGFSDTIFYLLGPADTGQPFHTFGWLPTHAAEGTFEFQQNPETGLFERFRGVLPPTLTPELLAVVDALPLPPETFRTNIIQNLIIALCHVKETQAKERLAKIEESGLIVDAGHGHYKRTLIA